MTELSEQCTVRLNIFVLYPANSSKRINSHEDFRTLPGLILIQLWTKVVRGLRRKMSYSRTSSDGRVSVGSDLSDPSIL
jgi:hypothetical protein